MYVVFIGYIKIVIYVCCRVNFIINSSSLSWLASRLNHLIRFGLVYAYLFDNCLTVPTDYIDCHIDDCIADYDYIEDYSGDYDYNVVYSLYGYFDCMVNAD